MAVALGFGVKGMGVINASGVRPARRTLVSIGVGELLGGIAEAEGAGPIRRIDSDSARDNVLGLKLSLLDDRESLEVTRITFAVSS